MQGDEGDEILGLINTDERLDQKNCYLWSCRESGMALAAEKVRQTVPITTGVVSVQGDACAHALVSCDRVGQM